MPTNDKQPEVVALGYDDDGRPAVVIEATMVEGKGRFDMAFGAAMLEETPSLVFLDDNRNVIGTFPYTDTLDDWLTDVLDHEQYHTYINYEVIPESIFDMDGEAYAFPVLGRDVGRQFDYDEVQDLPMQVIEQMDEILATLQQGCRTDEHE